MTSLSNRKYTQKIYYSIGAFTSTIFVRLLFESYCACKKRYTNHSKIRQNSTVSNENSHKTD